MSSRRDDEGFSLIEAMIAMVISGIALMGAIGAVEITSRHIQQAGRADLALALAQSRLEVKRSVRWLQLLEDDLDHDGVPETIMRDDGQGPDMTAADGIYTSVMERDGVTVVWNVETDRPGPLRAVGMVTIKAVSSYQGSGGKKEVRLATYRANPTFVGER